MLSFAIRVTVIAFLACLSSTAALAQAAGHVRVKFAKAGLIAGGGMGSGVLTYRGRDYRFTVSGLSLGVTAGASLSRLEGTASGIVDVNDFAGTYSAVGSGGALVGGAGGVRLRNEKGVVLDLKGSKAGLEFAANVSAIRIALNR